MKLSTGSPTDRNNPDCPKYNMTCIGVSGGWLSSSITLFFRYYSAVGIAGFTNSCQQSGVHNLTRHSENI